MVEQRSSKPPVVGSSPATPAIKLKKINIVKKEELDWWPTPERLKKMEENFNNEENSECFAGLMKYLADK